MSGFGSGTVTVNSLPVPLNFTSEGPATRAPADLLNDLITLVQQAVPGFTASLPGSLIEDLSSTATGALMMIDQAFVEFINSIAPTTQNAFILAQLGLALGLVQGQATNTSVAVEFSTSPATPGFAIPAGFLVSDGTNQYSLQEGAITGAGGTSNIVTAVATAPGSFAVPANTVTTLVTTGPSTFTLMVTNPQAGTPAQGAESIASFRGRVLQAMQAISNGVTTEVKTAILSVPGVVPRLVSMRLIAGVGWEIIVGGGDVYQVANAIFQTIGGNLPLLSGSVMSVTSITNANPGVVTTNLNHGFPTGAVITINGATGISGINGVPLTITVLSPTTFSIGINTTSSGTYTGGGVVTPNNRNVTVNVYDPPDTYPIIFVQPPQEVVTMTVLWNTTDANFTAAAAVAAATIPALVAEILSIEVGQPLNLLELNNAFLDALTGIIDPTLITRLVFQVSINGNSVSPTSGTYIIPGDPESYFTAVPSGITVNQG